MYSRLLWNIFKTIYTAFLYNIQLGLPKLRPLMLGFLNLKILKINHDNITYFKYTPYSGG